MEVSHSPQPPAGELRLFALPSFPEIYEQALVGPLFDPWVGPLLEDISLAPGDRVLDLACGTGIVARRIRERLGDSGAVVGVDLNPQMLTVAARVAPAIDWRQGEAGSLPLREGEQFDAVVCQQGFQFFPDTAAAAREVHRALAGGGRLAASTWRPDEEFPVLRQLRSIAEKHLGPVGDRRHSMGDAARLEAELRAAGFRDVSSHQLSRTIRFADGAVFVRLNATALVGMSAGSAALSDDDRSRLVGIIAKDSAELVQLHTDRNGFSYEIGTNVTVARA